jgi:predicted nucleotidyltransferase
VSLPENLSAKLTSTARQEADRVPGLRLVVLFGSVATGQARPDSDADLALLGGDFWRALELGATLAGVLARQPHVIDLSTAPDMLQYEVAKTGIPLYEAEPWVWARFQARAMLSYFDLRPLRSRCAEGVRRRLRREAGLEADGCSKRFSRSISSC